MENLSPSQRLSVSIVLLSSLLAPRAGREALLRAGRAHNGKTTHFLAEYLRHAPTGFGEGPTFSHVTMDPDFKLDDDFTLSSSESDNSSSTSKMCHWEGNTLIVDSPQPEYNNNTTARRSRSPTRDRDNNNYRDQRSPANNYDRSDRRPSRSEQPAGNMEDRQNSQQDRRVYVGNLSYDVKWHHLKDHMREGTRISFPSYLLTTSY